MLSVHPNSFFQRKWNVFILFIILYNVAVIPFQLAFNYYFGPIGIALNYFLDIFLFADIYFGFFRSYFHEGLIIKDLKKIRDHYLRGWFFYDLISVFPLEICFLFLNTEILESEKFLIFLRLNRLFRVIHFFRYFSFLERRINVNASIVRIIKLFFSVIINAHWISCAWFYIAFREGLRGLSSWVVVHGLLDADVFTQYVRSFYWALTTMTTVGYGDITPKTILETLFTMLAMGVGVSTYAYIIGNMANLIANIDAQAQAFRAKMNEISSYMQFREIPKDLQRRVRSYYDYSWARTKDLDEGAILKDLPSALRVEISLYLHREVLAKVPIFQGAEQGFLNALVMMLKPVIAAPGDHIIRFGDVGKEMYFISRGKVDVVSGDGKVIFASLGEGNFFGEIALLFAEKRTASVVSSAYCDLFRLDKEKLQIVLKDYPKFKEEMMDVAKKRYKKS